jgi:hypothetical protein
LERLYIGAAVSHDARLMAVSSPVSVTGLSKTRSITLRALFAGSLLAIGVNLATPFNDYVVVNTFLVGSYLPLALMLTTFFLVMIGNGLLRAVLPRYAFHTGEIAVMLMMLLVACSIPSQGLLRQLVPSLTTPFYYGDQNPGYFETLRRAGIPDWLFPAPISNERSPSSEIIKNFYGKVADGDPIPYGPWIKPILTWGVYLAGFFSACVALAYLFRIQWAENERLAFPLVQLQTSLIEAPEPGRALNSLFRHKSFWITAAAILVVHSFNAMHLYEQKVWPEIPRYYDLRPVTSEPPWSYFGEFVRTSTIYFTFIGATYFIRSRTAFSIWFIFLAMQCYQAFRSSLQIPVPGTQTEDQHIGACVAFVISMIWIGRALLWNALKGAFGFNHKAGRDQAWAMRLLLLGIAIMFGWMLVCGFHPILAVVSIAMVLMAHVVTGRIVAETGIPYLRTNPTVLQLVQNLPVNAISTRDTFFAGMMSVNGAVQTRESLFGLSQHGMRLMDETGALRKRFGPLMLIIGWTLIISLAAGWWSSLTCYYSYAAPISPNIGWTMLNQDIATNHTKNALVDSVVAHSGGSFPQKAYDARMHIGIGFAVVVLLQVGSWSFAAWPLLPIGFVLSGTPLITNAWFSVLIGWLAKVILQKLGGNKLLTSARPIFIGLIFGEALAAAIWMLITFLLAINGYNYFRYSALPT